MLVTVAQSSVEVCTGSGSVVGVVSVEVVVSVAEVVPVVVVPVVVSTAPSAGSVILRHNRES